MSYAGHKVTLPIGPKNHPKELDPVRQYDPWLHFRQDGWHVYKANCGGVHTENTRYARCELREKKAWTNAHGTHRQKVQFKVVHLPKNKPHCVIAQIHDDEDDIVEVRIEGHRIFLEADGKDLGTLDNMYTLGDPFKLSIRATSEGIRVKYVSVKTGFTKERWHKVRGRDWYFKAGCYVQSSTDNKSPFKDDAANDYAEVWMKDYEVSHV